MLGDYQIDEVLCKWCDEVGVDHHMIYYTATPYSPTSKKVCEIIIYYPRPGYLIGKAGIYVDKYRQELEKCLETEVKIRFVETNVPMSPEEWDEYFQSRGF